jgi:hypothetical protein
MNAINRDFQLRGIACLLAISMPEVLRKERRPACTQKVGWYWSQYLDDEEQLATKASMIKADKIGVDDNVKLRMEIGVVYLFNHRFRESLTHCEDRSSAL